MDLSVITVTWNSKKVIGEQIRSVQAGCTALSYEQFIVDNASSDGTGKYIEQEFPEVRFIQNRKNNGFGAANNQAAKDARGDYFLFLNPDMRVAPGTLDILLAWMKANPRVGLASCLLVDAAGQPHPEAQPRRFPHWKDQLAAIFHVQKFFPAVFERYLFKDFNPQKEQTVDTIRGSFMLMRREIYEKLGWAFDPRYHIWFEDVDTCREVWRLGLSVTYTPIITCFDMVGHSFKQRASFWKHQQFTKSMVIYFKKWEPWYIWLSLSAARFFSLPFAWAASFIMK